MANLSLGFVDVLADVAKRTGLRTRVIRVNKKLWTPETIRAVAQCDIVFGCMDTVDGRDLLNCLATTKPSVLAFRPMVLSMLRKQNRPEDDLLR